MIIRGGYNVYPRELEKPCWNIRRFHWLQLWVCLTSNTVRK